MAYRMRMFMSQKPSSVDLRVSDFKRVPGFNYVLSVLAEDEHTYDSLCSDIREAWSINASNGLQIYAFPEGTKDESATFVNTPKVFQSVMSVWWSRPSDLGSDMWLAVVEIPSKQQNAPLFGTLEVAAPLSVAHSAGELARKLAPKAPAMGDGTGSKEKRDREAPAEKKKKKKKKAKAATDAAPGDEDMEEDEEEQGKLRMQQVAAAQTMLDKLHANTKKMPYVLASQGEGDTRPDNRLVLIHQGQKTKLELPGGKTQPSYLELTQVTPEMLDKDGKFKKGTVYVSCRWPACAKGDGFRGYPKAWQVNGRLTLAAFKTNHTARHCPAMKILESLSPEELRQLAEAPLTESLALGAAAAQKIAAKGQAEEAGGAAGGDEASGGSIMFCCALMKRLSTSYICSTLPCSTVGKLR